MVIYVVITVVKQLITRDLTRVAYLDIYLGPERVKVKHVLTPWHDHSLENTRLMYLLQLHLTTTGSDKVHEYCKHHRQDGKDDGKDEVEKT